MQSCMRRTLDKWQLLYTHSFSRGRRGRVGGSGGGGGGGGGRGGGLGGLVKCTFYHFSNKDEKMFGHAARKVVGKSLWLAGKVCFLSI